MTAEETFKQFLTDGHGDSEPVNVEIIDEVKEVTNDEGYKTTLITTGFKLSIPGTYSSVEHSETVEVYGDVDLKEVRNKLAKDTANHTYVVANHYLKTLLTKVQ